MPAASVLRPRRCPGAITIFTVTLLLGLPGICTSASAGQNTPAATVAPVIEETFVLKHLKPSSLVSFLAQGEKAASPSKPGAAAPRDTFALLPASIKSVTPDDVYNTVTIQGAPEAIAAIRRVATLLDVPAQSVRLTIRIIRYRTPAPTAQKAVLAGAASRADVEEVASGVVETASNIPVEVTTYGDRHTFRARLIPHINNAGSVSIAADLQMATPDGVFTAFPADPSGTRLLRIGDRGLITSVGTGISAVSRAAAAGTAESREAGTAEKPVPETYFLEVTPSFPPAAKPR